VYAEVSLQCTLLFVCMECVAVIARHMERYKQEDAHEFLRCLVDAMQKRLLINCNQ